jgi:hypothetical protein
LRRCGMVRTTEAKKPNSLPIMLQASGSLL